jgi:hypothetical protein
MEAGTTLGSAYKVLADAAIWVLVVFVPIVAPICLVIWLIWFLTKRGRKPAPRDTSTGDRPLP